MRLKALVSVPAVLAAILVVLASCAPLDDTGSSSEGEGLFQVSTISALSAGRYDGLMSYEDLEEHGDFGLGTFEALDGEMVALDGDFYQVRSDGVAYPVEGDQMTPFAAVINFDADEEATIDESLTCQDLQARIDSLLPSGDAPYALRISGEFASVLTRSVAPQEPPYPPLDEALEGQIEFPHSNVEGTIVGFRLPETFAGVNATGYHFHFITDDRESGGHVLDCQSTSVDLAADEITEWHVSLGD